MLCAAPVPEGAEHRGTSYRYTLSNSGDFANEINVFIFAFKIALYTMKLTSDLHANIC